MKSLLIFVKKMLAAAMCAVIAASLCGCTGVRGLGGGNIDGVSSTDGADGGQFESGVSAVGYGGIGLAISDGFTGKPIKNACAVIAETNARGYSDENGCVLFSHLPVLPDRQYDELYPSDVGRVTLIIYAEGYVTYLLLYVRIRADYTRENVEILMFEDDGSIPVFQIIEAPQLDWAAGLVDRFRP